MVRSCIYIILLLLLCTACGQVGTITGGPEDVSSPRVMVDEVSPPMESTSIYPMKITLPFNEFIAFNQPAKNIIVTPADVKLNYKIEGKSVILSIKEGEWQPNTTYTVYLNRAVKDITEQNDSIIAYVFSTGTFLDSLQTAVKIEDAYNGKPIKDITVGLYQNQLIDDTSKVNPRYFSTTDKRGIATFRHLSKASYYVYAFRDENRNNRLDKSEDRATLSEPVKLTDSSMVDLPTLRLMPPEIQETRIVNSEIIPANNWGIGFNRKVDSSQLKFIDSTFIKAIWNTAKDSVTAYFHYLSNTGNYRAVLNIDTLTDTISKRYFFKDKPQLSLTTNLHNKVLFYSDTLKLTTNEILASIDTTSIQMKYIPKEDTIPYPLAYQLVYLSPLQIGFIFSKKDVKQVFLSIPPYTVNGKNFSLSDSLNIDFTLQESDDVGNLIISLDTIPESGILYVTNTRTKKSYQIPISKIGDSIHRLNHLQPGKYSYHFLYDKNKDGKWTTGSIFTHRSPEKIKWFGSSSTVRANWDVKAKLKFKPSLDSFSILPESENQKEIIPKK